MQEAVGCFASINQPPAHAAMPLQKKIERWSAVWRRKPSVVSISCADRRGEGCQCKHPESKHCEVTHQENSPRGRPLAVSNDDGLASEFVMLITAEGMPPVGRVA
jgi:hypothetical protein